MENGIRNKFFAVQPSALATPPDWIKRNRLSYTPTLAVLSAEGSLGLESVVARFALSAVLFDYITLRGNGVL
jgi:hypothetical protein